MKNISTWITAIVLASTGITIYRKNRSTGITDYMKSGSTGINATILASTRIVKMIYVVLSMKKSAQEYEVLWLTKHWITYLFQGGRVVQGKWLMPSSM